MKFFVQKNNAIQGPYAVELISQKVEKGELAQKDQVYLYEQDEWLAISELLEITGTQIMDMTKIDSELAPTAVRNKPTMQAQGAEPARRTSPAAGPAKADSTSPQSASEMLAKGAEWYVLKGENRYGPFPIADVVKMLVERALFEYDFAWSPGMEQWTRIAQIPAFSFDRIKAFLPKDMQNSEMFFRRKYMRKDFKTPLVVHNNSKVWKGFSVEISEGGACIAVENAMILPGQNIYVHFKGTEGARPFNVLCEVVAKRYVPGLKTANDVVYYGLKFLNIHKQDKDLIRDMAKQAA